MLAVAGTGPLNYLVWIGSSEVLREICGSVIVPPEVRNELFSADAPSVVCTWAGNLPRWIEVLTAETPVGDDPRLRSLDLGERAAIALASENRPCVLLIDERPTSFQYPKSIVNRLLEQDARRR